MFRDTENARHIVTATNSKRVYPMEEREKFFAVHSPNCINTFKITEIK